MARGLAAQGVSVICATPHTTHWARAGDTQAIQARVGELQQALAQAGIAVQVLPGAEVHVEANLAEAARHRRITTLNGTDYVLLEFAYDSLSPGYERLIFELQLAGLRVVLAHPERITPFVDEPGRLFELISRGCLGQITAASLAGRFGKRVTDVARRFVEHRLVHVIASDAHDAAPGGRLDALASARETAISLIGEPAAASMMEELPAMIVAGQVVMVEAPLPPKARRWWFAR